MYTQAPAHTVEEDSLRRMEIMAGLPFFGSCFGATYSNTVIVLIINSLQQKEFINITKMNYIGEK